MNTIISEPRLRSEKIDSGIINAAKREAEAKVAMQAWQEEVEYLTVHQCDRMKRILQAKTHPVETIKRVPGSSPCFKYVLDAVLGLNKVGQNQNGELSYRYNAARFEGNLLLVSRSEIARFIGKKYEISGMGRLVSERCITKYLALLENYNLMTRQHDNPTGSRKTLWIGFTSENIANLRALVDRVKQEEANENRSRKKTRNKITFECCAEEKTATTTKTSAGRANSNEYLPGQEEFDQADLIKKEGRLRDQASDLTKLAKALAEKSAELNERQAKLDIREAEITKHHTELTKMASEIEKNSAAQQSRFICTFLPPPTSSDIANVECASEFGYEKTLMGASPPDEFSLKKTGEQPCQFIPNVPIKLSNCQERTCHRPIVRELNITDSSSTVQSTVPEATLVSVVQTNALIPGEMSEFDTSTMVSPGLNPQQPAIVTHIRLPHQEAPIVSTVGFLPIEIPADLGEILDVLKTRRPERFGNLTRSQVLKAQYAFKHADPSKRMTLEKIKAWADFVSYSTNCDEISWAKSYPYNDKEREAKFVLWFFSSWHEIWPDIQRRTNFGSAYDEACQEIKNWPITIKDYQNNFAYYLGELSKKRNEGQPWYHADPTTLVLNLMDQFNDRDIIVVTFHVIYKFGLDMEETVIRCRFYLQEWVRKYPVKFFQLSEIIPIMKWAGFSQSETDQLFRLAKKSITRIFEIATRGKHYGLGPGGTAAYQEFCRIVRTENVQEGRPDYYSQSNLQDMFEQKCLEEDVEMRIKKYVK